MKRLSGGPAFNGPSYATTEGNSVKEIYGRLRPLQLGKKLAEKVFGRRRTLKIYWMTKSMKKIAAAAVFIITGATIQAQNGAIDPSFVVGQVLSGAVRGKIYAIAPDSSGGVLIAGDFNSIGGTTRNNIAKLDGQGNLVAFGTTNGVNGPIRALLVQSDGKILIGGEFTAVDGQGRNRIARLNSNGSLDTTFSPGTGVNGTVFAIASAANQFSGSTEIIIGGDFTSYNGVNRGRVAQLNSSGTLNSASFNSSGANGTVYTILNYSDYIYLGGAFTSFNEITKNRLVRFRNYGSSLNLDTSFNAGTGPNGPVFCISAIPSLFNSTLSILVGGAFTEFDGYIRGNIAAISVSSFSYPSGSLDLLFDVWADGQVTSIANANSQLYYSSSVTMYIAGDFQIVNGVQRKRLAQIVLSASSSYSMTTNLQGNVLAGFNPEPGVDAKIATVSPQSDSRIYVGGEFSSIRGVNCEPIARLMGNYGTNLPTPPNEVAAKAVGSRDVIVTFSGATNANSYLIERSPDSNSWTQFAASSSPFIDKNLNSNQTYSYRIRAINYNGQSIYSPVASCTTDAVQWAGPGAALQEASTNLIVNGSIKEFILQPDDKIVIVGSFSQVNGLSRKYVARLNPNLTTDSSFNVGTGFNSSVKCVGLQPDGKLVLSGYFSRYNETAVRYIVRLNQDGSLDTTFDPGLGPDSPAETIAVQSDGKILIGGSFNTFDGLSQERVARLNAGGSLDYLFRTTPNSTIYKILLLNNGKIFLGGSFSSVNGKSKSGIALINPNGSLDESFNAGSGGTTINEIQIQQDGKILIGGSFTTFSGTARNRIARLNADGSLDNLFDPKDGANNTINTISVDQSGWILIGGDFTRFHDQNTFRIARLDPLGKVDSNFRTGLGMNSTVSKIQANQNIVVAAGSFSESGGSSAPYLVRLLGGGNTDPAILSEQYLPTGGAGQFYSYQLFAAGGKPPYNWSLDSGNLPSGTSINSNGLLFGTPVPTTNAAISIKVSDIDGKFNSKSFYFNAPDQYPVLKIIEAFYGANGVSNNVITILNNAIDKDSLNLNVSNTNLGGDPNFGVVKTLYVKYLLQSGYYQISANEGSTIIIPSGAAVRLPENTTQWFQRMFSSYQQYVLVGNDSFWQSDLDNDGLSNLIESSIGGNPLTYDTSATRPFGQIENDSFAFYFKCDAFRNDLTYIVQDSADLIEWRNIAISVSGAMTSSIENRCLVTDTGVGLRTVKILTPISLPETPRRMIRLKVSK